MEFSSSRKISREEVRYNILSEVDFLASSNGITVFCSRLYTPRFIPYDLKGKCKQCKSNSAEMDILVTKEGISVWCTRMKGEKFIAFDIVCNMPDKCYFRVKSRGKVFTIPYRNEKKTSKDAHMFVAHNELNKDQIKTEAESDLQKGEAMETSVVPNENKTSHVQIDEGMETSVLPNENKKEEEESELQKDEGMEANVVKTANKKEDESELQKGEGMEVNVVTTADKKVDESELEIKNAILYLNELVSELVGTEDVSTMKTTIPNEEISIGAKEN